MDLSNKSKSIVKLLVVCSLMILKSKHESKRNKSIFDSYELNMMKVLNEFSRHMALGSWTRCRGYKRMMQLLLQSLRPLSNFDVNYSFA
eukprot:scaffold149445_cov19-Prasinocladus_malaysianus.AAC.1